MYHSLVLSLYILGRKDRWYFIYITKGSTTLDLLFKFCVKTDNITMVMSVSIDMSCDVILFLGSTNNNHCDVIHTRRKYFTKLKTCFYYENNNQL